MVEQITKGIKVSVETHFEGAFSKNSEVFYAFGYTITITNNSRDTVKLLSRCWTIYDSLNDIEQVTGEGVIGKKPVLQPGNSHQYTSGCLLKSPFGAMNGYYTMINFTSSTQFQVGIPTFKLNSKFNLN